MTTLLRKLVFFQMYKNDFIGIDAESGGLSDRYSNDKEFDDNKALCRVGIYH